MHLSGFCSLFSLWPVKTMVFSPTVVSGLLTNLLTLFASNYSHVGGTPIRGKDAKVWWKLPLSRHSLTSMSDPAFHHRTVHPQTHLHRQLRLCLLPPCPVCRLPLTNTQSPAPMSGKYKCENTSKGVILYNFLQGSCLRINTHLLSSK